MNTFISAIQHIRPLRGGAQSHLLRASDGNLYVTKFQNNPQHIRVLANEVLATRLGVQLGLPTPPVQVIEVSDWLIEHSPELRFQLAGQQLMPKSGKQLGSLYVGQDSPGLTFDWLPHEMLNNVSNLADFARVLVLDKWTCNSDGRQAVFSRKSARSRKYTATFVDQGYCFNASEWSFPDYPLRGIYANNSVYESVTGWDSFEPALSQAESIDEAAIWSIAEEIPEEWYEEDRARLEWLITELSKRRGIIRTLIDDFRRSIRSPFANWKDGVAIPVSCDLNSDEPGNSLGYEFR